MSAPPTSLIICSRNRPDLLADAVASILQGDRVPDELIIVDQSDRAHPRLGALTTERGCALRYLLTPSVGLSRANNVGIAEATNEVLAFTHDDVLVTPTWLRSIVSAQAEAGPRALVTGRVERGEPAAGVAFAPSTRTDESPAVYEGRIGDDVLYPLNMAMYRSAAVEIGAFDERLGPGTSFPAAEDNDFGFRALERGYRICYVPEAVVYHRAWRSQREFVRLRWAYGRGQGAYFAKYLSLRDRYMLVRLIRSIRDHLVASLREARHDRLVALGHLAYLAGILSGAGQWALTEGNRPSVRAGA